MVVGHHHRFFYDIGNAAPDRESVESIIADIAFVFHWPLADLLEMELAELLMWRGLAIDRWNSVNSPPPKK